MGWLVCFYFCPVKSKPILTQTLPTTGVEPMTLGSPTSPKPGGGAQFLPGFLMGDLPTPVTPQPRSLSGPSVGVMEMRSPLLGGKSVWS